MSKFNNGIQGETQRQVKEMGGMLSLQVAPQSLHNFAKNIAMHAAATEPAAPSRPVRSRMKRRLVGVAFGTVAVAILLFSAQVSPAFASLVQYIPGFSVASDWLTTLRTSDGVQNAGNHDYRPFQPVVLSFGDTKVSLSDVYLTSDRLVYKVFVQSDKISGSVTTWPDGTPGIDYSNAGYHVTSKDFPSAGAGGVMKLIHDEQTGEPILVLPTEQQLSPQQVADFLAGNPSKLSFTFYEPQAGSAIPLKHSLDVPFDKSQWKQDRIIPQQASIPVTVHSEQRAIEVQEVKITPLSTYIILHLNNKNQSLLDIDWSNPSIELTDNAGGTYQFKGYTSLNSVPGRSNSGSDTIRLEFASSPYFSKQADQLNLKIGHVQLSEVGSFSLAMDEMLPKLILFSGKQMLLTESRYEDGFLKLKLKQDAQNRMSIDFNIPGYMAKVLQSQELYDKFYAGNRDQAGFARNILQAQEGRGEYEVWIAAPEQKQYEVEIINAVTQREQVQVNQQVELRVR
ncbi:hypothetical protein MKY64_23440 [Paenibacillus sp. FSL R7-0210]|uniref:hypothetical protein n=1 Tax=Paenibacillus sp. FSL R7-0210 TaxID=2921676 RepID=UPI0030F8A6FC